MDCLRVTTPAPINTLLLMSARRGFSGALKLLFSREDAKAPPMITPTQEFLDLLLSTGSSTTGRSTAQQSCVDGEDGIHRAPTLSAASLLLQGVTVEGDTALHVVSTHGDRIEYQECATIIFNRAQDLMFTVNKNGDTPMHCAARAGNCQIVACLIELARSCNKVHELLRKENGLKETALHDAVRTRNNYIMKILLAADPELANYPEEGTSPLYLAISLENNDIARDLHHLSNGNLSYCGPNGQNALHAATFRGTAITECVFKWNSSLRTHRDRDGSTPLHFASSFKQHSLGFRQLFEANPVLVYQADNKGLYPIHVAASMGALAFIIIILQRFPSAARLCTAEGQTFLHVAAEKGRWNIVSFVCRTKSLACILDARDHDGNTALHLAVQDGNLQTFCCLYGNKKVHLSLPNNNGQTPIDLARNKLPCGIHFTSNNERCIYLALTSAGATNGCHRVDKFERLNPYVWELQPEDMAKEAEKVKDAIQTLGIGSVLITTAALGANFAILRGYIADGHMNGGTPTHSGRFSFLAFMIANTLAFICSSISTIGLMFSGSSFLNLRSRLINLSASGFFMSSSLTSLAAAFALGVYIVVAPVAHGTAIAVCLLSALLVLYRLLGVFRNWGTLARPLCRRIGLVRGLKKLAWVIGRPMLVELWPFIFIFGWAAIA